MKQHYFLAIIKLVLTAAILCSFKAMAQQVELAWAKSMGAGSSGSGYSLTADVLGNVYVTGYFQGRV